MNNSIEIVKSIRENQCKSIDDKFKLLSENAAEIAKALEDNTSVVHVDFTTFSGDIDYSVFAHTLLKNKMMVSLTLTLFSKDHLTSIAQGLKQNRTLKKLILNMTLPKKSGKEEALGELFEAIQFNKTLETLEIPAVNMSKMAAEQLLTLLTDNDCSLTSLNLNSCTVEGSKLALINVLTQALEQNKSLQSLNIGGEITEDYKSFLDSLEAMAYILVSKNNALQHLDLSCFFSRSVSPNNANAFFPQFKFLQIITFLMKNSALKSLSFKENNFYGCDLWRNLHKDKFEASFYGRKFEVKSIFLDALKESSLMSLNIRNMVLSKEGLEELSKAVRDNFTLGNLDLFDSDKEDDPNGFYAKNINPYLVRNTILVYHPKRRAMIISSLEHCSANLVLPLVKMIFEYLGCEEDPKKITALAKIGMTESIVHKAIRDKTLPTKPLSPKESKAVEQARQALVQFSISKSSAKQRVENISLSQTRPVPLLSQALGGPRISLSCPLNQPTQSHPQPLNESAQLENTSGGFLKGEQKITIQDKQVNKP